MKFVVAVDKNWGIGHQGQLLDYLPGDLAFFKNITNNGVLVLGRKTLETFPEGKPLKNRLHLILTSNKHFPELDNVITVSSIENLKNVIESLNRSDIFLIGGESVYHSLIDHCEGGYVTHINHTYDKVDAYFPNLSQLNQWKMEKILGENEDHGIQYQFCYYKNMNPKWGNNNE